MIWKWCGVCKSNSGRPSRVSSARSALGRSTHRVLFHVSDLARSWGWRALARPMRHEIRAARNDTNEMTTTLEEVDKLLERRRIPNGGLGNRIAQVANAVYRWIHWRGTEGITAEWILAENCMNFPLESLPPIPEKSIVFLLTWGLHFCRHGAGTVPPDVKWLVQWLHARMLADGLYSRTCSIQADRQTDIQTVRKKQAGRLTDRQTDLPCQKPLGSIYNQSRTYVAAYRYSR